ncbi:cytochrome c family protein [Maritimibacter sp. HL-12]|uniref:c-type cytochrome n=1 Tax=Maritimibacter sp. HL-12 TaxID=1162418 RepID=UPI000A0F253A|nr:c-type cytochrome [Maritimibacter sp. HL-12]SMH48137.1 cytochrome c [Maritimibacter sp. HL-12]
MFNTNNLIKLGASAAGALLIMLLANWGASALYKVADDHHGDEEHAVVRGFNIGGDVDGEAEEEEEEVELAFADVYENADPSQGERVFGKCRACHKLEEGAHTTGPALYNIVGHEKAAMDGFEYSDALLAMSDETWTPENLDAWLEDPRGYAPGNKMTFAGLKDIEERADLIAYLATIGN